MIPDDSPIGDVLSGFAKFRALKGLDRGRLTELICDDGLGIEDAAKVAMGDVVMPTSPMNGKKALILSGDHEGEWTEILDASTETGYAMVRPCDGTRRLVFEKLENLRIEG